MRVEELKAKLKFADNNDEVIVITDCDNPIKGDGCDIQKAFSLKSDDEDINGFYIMTD